MRHEKRPGAPPPDLAAAAAEIQLSLHARVLDIGLAGLAIETDTRLTPQHSLGMRIGSESGELELSGYVVWCFFHGTATAGSGEQMPVYRAGIEFADVLTARATDLLRFLEAHAVVTMETRLFGRFRLEESGPVSLHSRAPLEVVAVRDGALVVDADLGLEPAVGASALVRVGLGTDTVPARVAEIERGQKGEAWRLVLAFAPPQPQLVERARGLLP